MDAEGVAEAFCAYASARFGGAVGLADPASAAGEGFDSQIVFVRLQGGGLPDEWRQPLVLRIQPAADRLELARREAAVQTWCADRGYPAPRVLAVLEPGELVDRPVQVMERAPGGPMLDAIRSRPWQTRRLLGRLAELQLQLHSLPVEGWPGHGDDVSLADRRLAMPRAFVPRLGDAELTDALARAEEIAADLSTNELVICHGDFHPLNVVIAGDRVGVIDWTDAALGDRHGDVSRTALLFHVAAVAVTGRAQRAVLTAFGPRLAARFLRVYRAGHPIDADRLRRWEALHCVHGWTQVAALHAGLLDGDTSKPDENRARVSPDLVAWLQARFERAAAR